MLLVMLAASLSTNSGYACSVFLIPGPAELVSNAELIVHVTAVDYAGQGPGNMRTTGVADSKVRFRIESVLKGVYAPKELELNGYLGSGDDWNDGEVPYTFVRRDGRSGSCFANTYRQGGQFVLLLTRVSVPMHQGDTPYTVNWAPLAPVNEQVRSADDPWVRWVKAQVQNLSKKSFTIVLTQLLSESSPGDAASLAEIQKKLDQMDFWNEAKYPALFGSLDQTCTSFGSNAIEITASRGTTTKNLRWLDSTCPKAGDSKAAKDLLDLVGMIKKASTPKSLIPQFLNETTIP